MVELGIVNSAPVARSLDIAEVLRDARLGPARLLREEPSTYDSLFETTNRLFDLLQERGIPLCWSVGLRSGCIPPSSRFVTRKLGFSSLC